MSLKKRPLGKTGVMLSEIGMGGIVLMNETFEKAGKLVKQSIESGVNYFDVAPGYGDAEIKMGHALQPWRGSIFLACKTIQRDRKGAETELANSLERLKTGHIDLYQFHAVGNTGELEKIMCRDGALSAFIKAKKEGRIRYIGLSTHCPDTAIKALGEYDFDTILFPVNFALHFRWNFQAEVIEKAVRKGIGVLAIKALAKQKWPAASQRKSHPKCWYQPIDEQSLGKRALYWALSQKITSLLPPGDESLYLQALQLAQKYRELTRQETALLEEEAGGLNTIFGG